MPKQALRHVAVVLTLLASARCGCEDPVITPVLCNESPPTFEIGDPCVEGSVVFGPVKFDRSTGSPTLETHSFSAPSDGQFCILIVNGSDIPDRIASANISIDDSTLFAPADFNQHVKELRHTGELSKGEHELSVELRSRPGAFVEVVVKHLRVMSEEDQEALLDIYRLQQLYCEEYNDSIQYFEEDEAQLLVDRQLALGMPPGQMRVRYNAYDVPRRLSPLPEEDIGILPDDSPEEIAFKWIEEHADLLRLHDTNTSFQVDQVKLGRYGEVMVRLVEIYNGIHVDGGSIEITIGRDGFVRRFVGNVVPAPTELIMIPEITEEEAIDSVLDHYGYSSFEGPFEGPYLRYLDISDITKSPSTKLAWRLQGRGNGDFPKQFWVDAIDGQVLQDEEMVSLFENQFYYLEDKDECVASGHDECTLLTALDTPNGHVVCSTESLPWCPDIQLILATIDTEWSLKYNRSGWSGDGLEASYLLVEEGIDDSIAADAPYRVIYNQAYPDVAGHILGLWWPALDDPYYSGTSDEGRWVTIPPNGLHADTLSHEFGHAFHHVETGVRGSAADDLGEMFSPISEHVASMQSIGRGTSKFGHERADGIISNDFFSSDSCVWPYSPTNCPTSCYDFLHMSFHDETWSRLIESHPDSLLNAPNPYWNSGTGHPPRQFDRINSGAGKEKVVEHVACIQQPFDHPSLRLPQQPSPGKANTESSQNSPASTRYRGRRSTS